MPSLRPGTGIVLLDDEHHTDEDGDAEGARVPADAAAVHASVGLLSRTDAGSGVLIREYVCVLVAPLPLIILLFPFLQRKTHRQSCAALAPAIRACTHTSSLTYQLGRAAVLVGRIMHQFTIAGVISIRPRKLLRKSGESWDAHDMQEDRRAGKKF